MGGFAVVGRSGLSAAHGSQVFKHGPITGLGIGDQLFGDVVSFKPPSGSGQNHFGLGAMISFGLGVRALRLATAVFAALRGQRVSLWLPLNFGCNEHTNKYEQPTSSKKYHIQCNFADTELIVSERTFASLHENILEGQTRVRTKEDQPGGFQASPSHIASI